MGKKLYRNNCTKQICIYILSFCIPVAAYAYAWARNGILYNGDVTPLVYDGAAQYMPFLSSLRYLFSGESSLFFNWSCDWGGDYYSLFSYYLASPLNVLTLFWDLENMANAIYALTLLKVGLCGLSFSVFIKYELSDNREAPHWFDIAFCCGYALSAYMFEYGSCIMWIDTLIILPVCLLMVSRLLDGKIHPLYILLTALLICVNFYMAFAAGIYILLFFVYKLVDQEETWERRKYIGRMGSFAGQSALAVLISMPLVLPTIIRVLEGMRIGSNYQESSFADKTQAGIAEFLLNFLPQRYNSLKSGYLPNVYCGTLILLLAAGFYTLRIPVRKKMATLLLWVPVMLGFIVPAVNVFWHGFQEPHAYPFRYAYLFPLGVLSLAYMFVTNEYIYKYILKYKSIALIGAGYIFIELIMNGTVLVASIDEDLTYSTKDTYLAMYHEYADSLSVIESLTDANEIYRIGEDNGSNTHNAGLLHNFNGTAYFSSTYNHYLNETLITLGSDSSHRLSVSSSLLWPLKSFWGIKYILSAEEMGEPFKKVDDITWGQYNVVLYENPYAISSIGYIIEQLNDEEIGNITSFSNYNSEISRMVFGENLYETIECEGTVENGVLTLYIPKDRWNSGTIYVYLGLAEKENDSKASAQIAVDGEVVRPVIGGLQKTMVEIQYPQTTTSSDIIRVDISNINMTYIMDIVIFRVNTENAIAALGDLKSKAITNIRKLKNGFEGTISSETNGTLVMTIPFEKGYRVYIDGEKVITKKALNTLLAAEAPAGNHTVKVQYIPYGFFAGLFLGIIGIIMTICISLYCKKVH